MNKAFKKIASLVVVATALVSGTALAAGPWSSSVTISDIEVDGVTGGTETYLNFTSTPSGKPACGTSSQVFLSGNADAVKAMTSVATAAYLAGRPVKVYWDGTCNGIYAKVIYVRAF